MSDKTMRLSGEEVSLPIDNVKPYWRNPRNITEESVNVIAESLKQYGYQQPIVVDSDNVIIVGHTRYAAMRRLGETEVLVRRNTTMTPDEVRQWRVIDNRVSEFTDWDYDKLADELEGVDLGLLSALFEEVDIRTEGRSQDEEILRQEWEQVDPAVEFVCPKCFHEFETNVSREDVFAGRIETKPEEADDEEA